MPNKTIFDHTTIKNLELKNRVFRSATWEALADRAGRLDDAIYPIYERLARGGVGCVISGFTSVASGDFYFDGMARLSQDEHIIEHRRLTELVHRYDVPIIAQLALGEYNRGYERNVSVDRLSSEDLATIRELFVSAAERASLAGYDGVQLHAAHGFFLSRFLSPEFNRRDDQYGKTPELLLVEIATEIRKRVPNLHLTMKINSADFTYGGLNETDSLRVCEACAAFLDSIEASGNGTSRPGIRPGVNEGYFKPFALKLAERVAIPVILVGGLRSVDCMNAILNEGKIEYLSLSRPLIREPDLVARWLSGDLRPSECVSCNICYGTPGHGCVFNLRR